MAVAVSGLGHTPDALAGGFGNVAAQQLHDGPGWRVAGGGRGRGEGVGADEAAGADGELVAQVLDAVEQQAFRQAVLDHYPCGLGLARPLWTRAGVRDLLGQPHRVRLTEQGVGKYLRPDKRVVESTRSPRGPTSTGSSAGG